MASPLPPLSLQGRSVLVCDDGSFAGAYLTGVLQNRGAEVQILRSCQDALAALSNGHDFAAAALSTTLPEGPPVRTMAHLATQAIPFLLWSAERNAARLSQQPDVAVLSWPFAAYEVADALHAILHDRQSGTVA